MKNLLFLAALLLLSTAMFAQKPGLSPEEKALLITNKMKEDQLISDAQFDRIYEINLKTAEEKKAKREAFKAQREAFQKELKTVEEKRWKAYEDVLTPEQLREVKIAQAKRKVAMARKKKLMAQRKAQFRQMNKVKFPPQHPTQAVPPAK